MLSDEFVMLLPSDATMVFFAIPAELNSFLFECTVEVSASGIHPELALAAETSALGLTMVGWTEPARQAANSHFYIIHLHVISLTPFAKA